MGTFELINALGSTALGGGLTMLGAMTKASLERARFQHLASLDRKKAAELATVTAREFRSTAGFHFTRRTIALSVVLCGLLAPVLAPVFWDVSVAIGYYDTTHGFWPWEIPKDSIHWVVTGNSGRVITISPILNNVILSITGMFFGNQFVK